MTRRGTQLLESGVVRVVALATRGAAAVLRVSCVPGSARLTARALAARDDTTFTYIVTGSTDCVAEVLIQPEARATFLLDELPALPGVVSVSASPVMRFHRTIHDWQPGLISAEEAARLGAPELPAVNPGGTDIRRVTAQDRAVIAALEQNGRRSYEEIARVVGVSEATARRRVEALRASGLVLIRSLVRPTALGLHVGALLWITAPPARVDELAARLVRSSHYVRYAASLMGDAQLVADVAVPSIEAMYDLTTGPWSEGATGLDASLVVQHVKTSGARWT